MYNFDEIIDRTGTISVKQGFRKEYGYPEDAIALWVADMDFKSPAAVCDSVVKAGELGVFGYAGEKDAYFKAFHDWNVKRHHWDIQKEWVVRTPGVVTALAFAVNAYTREGDAVMIMRPVYHPFTAVVENNHRKLVKNELIVDENCRFQIDFEKMERQMREEEVKLFILCSPHNPGGRIWTPEEMQRIADLCVKYGVILVVDEIHYDFVLPGHTHRAAGLLNGEIQKHLVVCTAPSKTFNVAGLEISNIVIPDEDMRKKFKAEMGKYFIGANNLIGMEACRLCYETGEEWLEELLPYLAENVDIVRKHIAQIPGARMMEPDGTYLLWIDLRCLGIEEKVLKEKLLREAKVWLNEGSMFGEEGTGWFRVNIGCPHSLLEKAMDNLVKYVGQMD